MLIKRAQSIRPSEITSETNYLNRRQFIRTGAIAGSSVFLGGVAVPPDVPDSLARLVSNPVLSVPMKS